MLPNDNVSTSVGHLDHVLTVYSSTEHVTWKSPGPICGWVSRIMRPDSCMSRCDPCHRLGQSKSGRQRGTPTDQMDKRGTLDQEDTDIHEPKRTILPTQPQKVISWSRAPSSCKQSRRDQDVQRPTYIETLSLGNILQLCRVRNFILLNLNCWDPFLYFNTLFMHCVQEKRLRLLSKTSWASVFLRIFSLTSI